MAARLSWTQPMCDACWRKRNGERNPSRLTIDTRMLEICSFCGQVTESGIYVREDPRLVPYPAVKES